MTAVLAAVVACRDQQLTTGPAIDEARPTFAISDAAHGGPAGFYFLPPLVPNPGPFPGSFDAAASPEVKICRLIGGACAGGTVAAFSLGSVPGLQLDAADQSFRVNWKTRERDFRANEVYRIQVFQDARLLGYLDVLIVTDPQDRKPANGDYVGLRPGKPLNVKFRVETRPEVEVGTIALSDGGDIHTIRADGTGLTNLTDSPAYDSHPVWSPNGMKIAYVSGTQGGDLNVYVMNFDGSNPVRLTSTSTLNMEPVWSPDGGRIAFVSQRPRFGRLDVFVMNADGTGEVDLTPDGSGWYEASDEEPAWSPDGTKVAFISDRQGGLHTDVFVVNADGTGMYDITASHDALERSPAWAPDGTRIAFAFEGETPEEGYVAGISVIDDIGGVQAILTTSLFNPGELAWRP